jgi:hypothetical protein
MTAETLAVLLHARRSATLALKRLAVRYLDISARMLSRTRREKRSFHCGEATWILDLL